MADKKSDNVAIMGCGTGIDWTIIHTNDGKVKHITNSGQEAIVDKEEYKKLVLNFADQVESFD